MSSFADLYGRVNKDQYVFIKCTICAAVYRWGRKHDWQALCPVCGATTFSPQEVDKMEYIKFLARIGNQQALEYLQQLRWNPQTLKN